MSGQTTLLSALGHRWRTARAHMRGSAIVLTYHRVGDVADDPHRLAVSYAHFVEQIEVIAAGHQTLTAAELAARVRTRSSLPRRAVIVTFDDGYAETHALAEPVLSAMRIRATSFLCSDSIGLGSEYPWDARLPEQAPDSREPGHEVGHAPRESRRVLGSAEILELEARGVFEFAAHTRTHPRLSDLDEAAQRDEITGGKASLETLLGHAVRTLAYPHGGHRDFDSTSSDLASEAGFDAAFTTNPGIVLPSADRFAIPRFHTEDIPGSAFRELLNGWFDAAR